MNLYRAAKNLDRIFYYSLLGILILNSLMYIFMFILNWEAWFFGMKMDGLCAGVILFTYFFISTILAYILYRYPRSILIISLLSILFFGFKFIDSAETVQELSKGLYSYNEFMIIFLAIPLVVLTGHIIVSRFYDQEGFFRESGQVKRSFFTSLRNLESGDYLSRDILALLIIALGAFLLYGMPGLILMLILIFIIIYIWIFKRREKENDERNKKNKYP